ncbi:MAG: hypothetical protein ACJA06_001009 [Halocynthiibacter sp.]|jgi:hypothetical protein
MFGKFKGIAIIGVIGFIAYGALFGAKSEPQADLGAILDRTEYALNTYQTHLSSNEVAEVTDANMEEFSGFLTQVLNTDPPVYSKPLGMNVQSDATFLGFADANEDGIQDAGEGKVFTVEIDEANGRLIATDIAGNSSGLRFSGSGILTGMLLGNMIGRQRGAGVSAASFNNRTVTPRSSYRSPTRARTGGPRSGK